MTSPSSGQARGSALPASDTSVDEEIFDIPSERARNPADLLHLIASVLGLAATIAIGVFATGTTAGITEDVRGVWALFAQFLLAPVSLIEGAITLLVPATVVVWLGSRREPRRIIEALAALTLGVAVVVLASTAITQWGTTELTAALSRTSAGIVEVSIPAYLAGLAAMLTMAGRRSSSRTLAALWNVLSVGAVIAAIAGLFTLTAIVGAILVGRAVGLGLRYSVGTTTHRAYGAELVRGISRAGFSTQRLVRIGAFEEETPDHVGEALSRTRDGRIYALTTREGHHLLVAAIDGDQRIADSVSRLWRTIRLRGITARPDVSLRHLAESTALASHAARSAGVRTPRILGMAHELDTMLLIYQRPRNVVPLSALPRRKITNRLVDAIWSELGTAHAAGVSHRSLTSDAILVGTDELTGDPEVWITAWDVGEVASSQLSRNMDEVQLIALTAGHIGARRAISAASRALTEERVSTLGPLFQSIVLPAATRSEIANTGSLLSELRDEVVRRQPDAPTGPARIARLSWRTIVSLTLGIVAAWLILTSFRLDEVVEALRQASILWVGAAGAWTVLTWVGATIAMLAFSPISLPWWRVFLAQVASSYVALTAPAGVGPAAVNLGLLVRRRVPSALAVASVALVQLAAIVVTSVGLIVLSLSTGQDGVWSALPSGAVFVVVGILAIGIATMLSIPRLRTWVLSRLMPTVRQTWPRLGQVLGQPLRLLTGLGGNLLLTVGYVGAFYSVMRAFGIDASVIDLTIVFLIGNTVGALVPTPGGLGAVEVALTTAVSTTIGVSTAVAGSAVVLFRAVTYWARIPFGYIAMKYLEREGEL